MDDPNVPPPPYQGNPPPQQGNPPPQQGYPPPQQGYPPPQQGYPPPQQGYPPPQQGYPPPQQGYPPPQGHPPPQGYYPPQQQQQQQSVVVVNTAAPQQTIIREIQLQPPDYMVQAILVTLCCFFPTGIVAIVYASRVRSLFDIGDISGSIEASSSAGTWYKISLGIGILLITVSVIIRIVLSASSPYY